MSPSPDKAFSAFVRSSCGDLIGQLSRALGTPLGVRGVGGEVILPGSSTDDLGQAELDGLEEISVPIPKDEETLGYVFARSGEPRIRDVVESLASDLGRRYDLYCDLEHMTDELSQTLDEINLLYEFARILRPDDSFVSNAHRLLDQTAELLERRSLVLALPELEVFVSSLGGSLSPSEGFGRIGSDPANLQKIHETLRRELTAGRAAGSARLEGVLDSPVGSCRYTVTPVWVHSFLAGFVGLLVSEGQETVGTGELRLLECLAEQITNMISSMELYASLEEANAQLEVRLEQLQKEIETRERAQAELKKSEEQLRQSQKMEALGLLAGGVAHDFNNILTAITGFAQILQSKIDQGSPLRSIADNLVLSGERATSLTRQLLAFGRKQVLEPTLLNLNSVVTDMEHMLQRIIGANVRIASDLDPGLSPIRAGRGQLEQVILNLAVNARDAMPQGGDILIKTENVELDDAFVDRYPDLEAGPYVKLTFTDTGCGMDEGTLLSIFDPFFTTKEKGKGTGLGLSTVYGIVKQTGGHITVESELKRGTIFTTYLPKYHEKHERSERHRESESSVGGGDKIILLVENEDDIRQRIRKALEEAGHTVMDADSGQAALDISSRMPYRIDLLITDLVMPGMGGRQLYERIKSRRPKMKVLFMSKVAEEGSASQPVDEGKGPVIDKPFSAEDLTRKIHRVLRRLPEAA